MLRMDFNKGWKYRKTDVKDTFKDVDLPHDAMLSEARSVKNPGAHNIGYFEGHDYEYIKTFVYDNTTEGKELTLEFEGVYHNARVYVNGKLLTERPYGYTNFYVPITKYLTEGENEIKVTADNSDQPNSRWYTGSGIYRPVWLYAAPKDHVNLNGIRLRTERISNVSEDGTTADAVVLLKISTTGQGNLYYKIIDDKNNVVDSGEAEKGEKRIALKQVGLWNEEHPALYKIKVNFAQDEAEEVFGIRTLDWDRKNGIRINGKRVIIKGACIHSDNQLLGAVTDPDAELRRVRILKKNGYNAIRSAHNPCSKYLLEACDKLGMYVMDEYVDMWYIHKTRYDYASYVTDWYERDLYDMVQKDIIHPSVIMYSTGNEVAETGQSKGIELTRAMTRYIHSLDNSRPVTCGVNIFFNFLFSMGFGVYSDKKAEKEGARVGKNKKAVGSEFYNKLAGTFGDKFMKVGATLHGCDLKTRDAYANMDIAGYNYGILRYKKDLKRYPDRLILGSETFCKDAYRFYELAKKEPGLVGDFVWAGMDYLGEAGIGSWEYEDYAPRDGDKAGWLSAGSGRIDLTGKAIGEGYYTRVVYEKIKGPVITVSPVYQTGRHSPSAWKMSDGIRSWSYSGCEGLIANIEVYARAHEVELFLNGASLGKVISKDCIYRFRTKYHEGDLTAVAYDENGMETGRETLSSAKKETRLRVMPEIESVGPEGLAYIRLRLTDSSYIWKPMEKREIKISVENGKLAGLGNGCPYDPDGFLKDSVKTYYGEALAIVRAGQEGIVKVTAVMGEERVYCNIPIK